MSATDVEIQHLHKEISEIKEELDTGTAKMDAMKDQITSLQIGFATMSGQFKGFYYTMGGIGVLLAVIEAIQVFGGGGG